MTIETIADLITNLGLPIALVIAMAFFIYKIYQQSVERENKLMLEIEENRKINEQAIATISLYAEKLDGIQEDIKEIKTDIIVIKNK